MKKHLYLAPILCAGLLSCSHSHTKNQVTSPASPAAAADVDATPNQLLMRARQLTFQGSKSGEAYFSPDGKLMIFQSERQKGNPFYQMYLMNLESGKTTRLSPGYGKTTCGWIHPSEKKVLFSSTHLDPDWKKKAAAEEEARRQPVKARYSWNFDENFDIFSSDLQGHHLHRLTKAKGYDAEASYSPDGEWIAFASNRAAYETPLSEEDQKYFAKDPSYMMDIYIMKADGSQVRRLTDSKGYDGGPFFSADGRQITWRRFAPNGMTAEIYTMDRDGRNQHQVTHLRSMSWAPYFHPSGDYLIFTSSVYGFANFELFIVDSQGRHKPVRVTFNEDFDGLPVFTPDGNHLSWTRRNAKGDSQIFMADWDDAEARRLLNLAPRVPEAAQLQPGIEAADIRTWIHYLSQPGFGGRKTGGESESVYTRKFAELLKSWGYRGLGPRGSFFHHFDFVSGVHLGSKNSLSAVGSWTKDFRLSQDFAPLSFSQNGVVPASPIVFAGYGIKAPAGEHGPAYDSYENLDVKGKWVIVLNDVPSDVTKERRHDLNTYSRPQHKVTVAKNAGARGVIFVNGPLSGGEDNFDALHFEGALADSSLAVLKMSTATAVELFQKGGQDLAVLQKKLDQGGPTEGFALPSLYLKAQVDLVFDHAQGTNVIAELPVRGAHGSLMIGAHGDHLGHGESGNSLAKKEERGEYHPGADDNASGVAGVMELAQAFASPELRARLKKSLRVAIWSGEEIGILGSSRWVQDYQKNHHHALKTDVEVYLNMDMIGRYREALFLQGVGSGDHWESLTEQVVARSHLPMRLQEDPYLPTDSMAFYLGGVPAANFFTGAHAEYHTPRDRPELINYEGEVKVLGAVQDYLSLLASNATPVLHYVKVAGNPQAHLEGRSFHVYLGTIPDYSQAGVKGVKISGVAKDSPAEKAGLRESDVIIEFDHNRIENLYDYVYALQAVKPGKETNIQVLRQGQKLEMKITPRLKE